MFAPALKQAANDNLQDTQPVRLDMAGTLIVAKENLGTSQHVNPKHVSGPALAGRQRNPWLLEIQAWMPSEIEAISPMVEQLMALVENWRCVEGDEFAVELALREALSNAVIHGNREDPNKSVDIRCRCERQKGIWLVVKDQGKGFDPNAVRNPLGPEGLQAEHGRGIHLMKLMMDEVSYNCSGSEVHMRKSPARHEEPLSNRISANHHPEIR
jgi:serine/threonine-protein kinase RsbW